MSLDVSRAAKRISPYLAGGRLKTLRATQKSLSEDQHCDPFTTSRPIAMAVTQEYPSRLVANGSLSALCLEDNFELLKEIGDGSFGSVALARVRTAGAHIARRGTMVSVLFYREYTRGL